MKKLIFAAFLVPFACSVSFGQDDEMHSEIEFGYDDFNDPTTIIVESDELTADGIQIIEGELISLFPGDQPIANNPGFITIATEVEGGERVNAGDEVFVRFLDASQNSEGGVGFVNFYNAATGELESAGQITIDPQTGVNSVLDGASVSNGVDSVLLSIGSDGATMSNAPDGPTEVLGAGEIHNHLVFSLDQDVAGAYGLLFQFESVPADGGDPITSAPIWLIFNNRLGETTFEEEAVAAFSAASVLLGDVNRDDVVNFLDIAPFIALLSNGDFQLEADVNTDDAVNFLDIAPFITVLSGQ